MTGLDDALTAFPGNPWIVFIIALGAFAGAVTAIWRLWLRPSVEAVKTAFQAAQEIVLLLRDIRDFFTEELPALKQQVGGIQTSLDEHIEAEDARMAALEQRRA